jgi:RpiB/LacA/LacB family sugar-phosphate isomerase
MFHEALAIGSDHAGFQARQLLISQLQVVHDLGMGSGEPVDYPEVAFLLADWVLKEKKRKGILLCGTGIGMSICANRIPGIRAALVHSVEEAILATEHNHANVLCLGVRRSNEGERLEWVQAWLQAKPSLEMRHVRRVQLCG